MQILFFVISILLGIFVGFKFFQNRMAKGHRKVPSGFWAFAAGFIVVCGLTIFFNLVLLGQGNQPISNLPPFDPNHALPAALIGDASTDEDSSTEDTQSASEVAATKSVEEQPVNPQTHTK